MTRRQVEHYPNSDTRRNQPFDAAEVYGTYPHLSLALKRTRRKIVIATKSSAREYGEMEEAMGNAFQDLGRNHIEIFLLHAAKRDAKRVIIAGLCKGCGTCVETCPNGALSIVEEKAQVDVSGCILCGYCSAACPEFAIRVA